MTINGRQPKKKGSPPKYPITVPDKIPRHHLSPQDAKHQDILHEHQNKILAKINSGEASPEDHYKFSRIRERLNQITTATMTKMEAAEQQTKPKFRKAVKNAQVENDEQLPLHQVERSNLQPDAAVTLRRRGIKSNAHLLHVLGAPTHLPIILHSTIAQKRPGTSPLIHTEVGAMPHYWMQRTIDPVSNIVHNDEIHITKTGTGLGSEIFANQVKHLTNLGFREIQGVAAREDYQGRPKMNGYYTWPRLGYNGLFSGKEKNKLPREFRGADSIHDLYKIPGGKEWWKANGWGKRLTFKLSPGSDSHKVLEAYMKERADRLKDAAENPKGPVSNTADRRPGDGIEEIDLAPWEEEALDKVWDNIKNKPTGNASTTKGYIDHDEIKDAPLDKVGRLISRRSVSSGRQIPGMASGSDIYRTVNVGGVNLHYAKEAKNAAAVVASQLHRVHPNLLKHASPIYFSSKLHVNDVHSPGIGLVYATADTPTSIGKKGSITFYSPSYSDRRLNNPWHNNGIMSTVVHELGHNLANHISNGLLIGGHKYGEAMGTEPPTSNYSAYHYSVSGRHKGGTGVLADAEDFAEGMKRYHTEPRKFKRSHPLKYQAIHELLNSPDHLSGQRSLVHEVITSLKNRGIDPHSFIQHDMLMHYNREK